jgi:hypothetical protein
MIIIINFLLKFILPIFLYIFLGGFIVAWVDKRGGYENESEVEFVKFITVLIWPVIFLWLLTDFIFSFGKSLFYKIDNKIEAHKLNKKTTYRD